MSVTSAVTSLSDDDLNDAILEHQKLAEKQSEKRQRLRDELRQAESTEIGIRTVLDNLYAERRRRQQTQGLTPTP